MFILHDVVPWGRSFDEYCRMFSLTDADLGRTILGCGDGPAGFNAEATRRGARVISCDPIYRVGTAQIRERIAATSGEVLQQTRQNAEHFVWDVIPSVEALGAMRMAAMEEFLADYESGRAAGRYVDASLPDLPFANRSFDLALCSHFLFLYSEQLGKAFHLQAVRELTRVASEVRIFPLLTLAGERSPFVARAVDHLRASGIAASIESVDYEFQRGGNQMLRVLADNTR